MDTKLFATTAIILGALLLFSMYQPGAAVPYYSHDGSIDEQMEKTKVSPLKGKKDVWVYLVRACATDHSMGVASVILKSDIDQKNLGVNKNIPKGKCSSYGAIMKAKNPDTLGAEMIEKHEALQRMFDIQNQLPTMTKQQKSKAVSEITYYKTIIGLL